ncbi:MAG: cell division protein FtsQ/DivIB [bacterium]|nr:cell division protein FtsQ/DivIB [bacterium]
MARHKIRRSPRLARRERRKTTQKVLLLAILFAAAVGAVLYGFSRPEFRIKTISVLGASRISDGSVRGAVEREISGTYLGFLPKAHTLLYPNTHLKSALLKAFPVFSSVSISLESLAAVRVSVHEREPRALWCQSESDCFLMDETGFVFAPAEPGTETLYYRLLKAATSSPLGTEVIDRKKLAAILSFLKELEDLGFDPALSDLKGGREIAVVLKGGVAILLNEGEYDRALSNLRALLGEKGLLPRGASGLSVSYIDLRYGNKIYFKPR